MKFKFKKSARNFIFITLVGTFFLFFVNTASAGCGECQYGDWRDYGCDGECDSFCDVGTGSYCDCSSECSSNNCPWDGQCVPSCWSCSYYGWTNYRGDGTCDAFCGETATASSDCYTADCVPSCTPDCTGKSCGDNGCGGSCGTCPNAGTSCRYSATCDAWNYRNTCSSGSCTGATEWTTDAADESTCNGYVCATGKVCSSGSCVTACSGCLISNTCYSNGAYNPSNGCQKCDTSSSTTSWTNVAAGQDPNNACAASGCSNTGNCNGAGSCQTPAEDTDPNNYCTASGCSNTGNCNGAGSCKTPGAGTDPNSACDAIDCDGGTTKYYWGWDTDNTCYYRSDVTAANAHCDGSGSCRSTATECGEEGKGATTGVTYHSSCRSGCSGTTSPSTANEGSGCGSGNVCISGSCVQPVCSAPTGLGCSEADLTQTKLSWSAVSGATNYRVEWCKQGQTWGTSGCCPSGICYATTSNTYYTITGLSEKTTYDLRVRVESASSCNVPGTWSSAQSCSTISGDQCWTSCVNAGYDRGECTTFKDSYGCSGAGSDFCYFGRKDTGGCGWTTNCWCSNVQNCDSCTLPNPDACTSSGCNPTKITTANCKTGSCSNPQYDCVYFKQNSGGSGIGSCIVGINIANWEGLTCSSVANYNSPCLCSHSGNPYLCPLTSSKDNGCPASPMPEGVECQVRIPCVGGTATIGSGGPCWNTASQYGGKYSKDDAAGKYECVQCTGTKKVKLLADTASIKVDCSGNAPSSALCETACGSDAACDEKNSGDCTTSTSLQKCSSSCSPVNSCGDGTVNCGEDCEPPNTATCSASCKATCTNCNNAKSMDKTSISLGQTATGALCSISSTNANDWFKVKANDNGKLIVEMTPSAADLDIEVDEETFIGGGCNNLVWLGKSQNGGANKETVIVNAAASYTYWIKTYYYSGSGATGTVTAKLVECVQDLNCPSAKPYCNNNKCGECMSDTNCATNSNGKYCDTVNNKCVECLTNNDINGDGVDNDQCRSYASPKTCESDGFPSRIARCRVTSKTCDVCGPCSTNSDCKNNFCCDKDPGLPVSDWGTGQCTTNVYKQKYLCT